LLHTKAAYKGFVKSTCSDKISAMELVATSFRSTSAKTVKQTDSLASVARISGESDRRLQAFARIHQNKKFSKQTAYEAFAGVTRKKTA
jgi:membrane-bound lytic murein transglycosylase B